MEETNVETITALFYEIWSLLAFSDKKKAAGYAWGLMGLTAKLAQSMSFFSEDIDFLILTPVSIFRSVSVCILSRELLEVYSYHLGFALTDCNGGKSKVIPEEVDKRRSLFWELLYLDARLVSPTAARGYGALGSPTNSRYRSADHLHFLSIIWTVPGNPTRRTRIVISRPALTIVS